MRRMCPSSVITRYVDSSWVGTTDVTGSANKKETALQKMMSFRNINVGGARTTDIVCTKLALAQIVCPDVTINGAGHDPRRPHVECLNGISSLFQCLYRLSILRTDGSVPIVKSEITKLLMDAPKIPQFYGRVIGTCNHARGRHRSVTIGNEHRNGLTACHDGGVSIKLHHINFCQVGGYPAGCISGGHIPKKD